MCRKQSDAQVEGDINALIKTIYGMLHKWHMRFFNEAHRVEKCFHCHVHYSVKYWGERCPMWDKRHFWHLQGEARLHGAYPTYPVQPLFGPRTVQGLGGLLGSLYCSNASSLFGPARHFHKNH